MLDVVDGNRMYRELCGEPSETGLNGTVNVPAVVGVPVIRTGLSASSSPRGSLPETNVHV